MVVKSAVRAIMERRGIGTNALARRIGKIPQTITDRLSPSKSTNLSIDKLDEMLSAMDYKIVLIPADTKVQDGWYVIEDSNNVKTEEEHE